MFNRCWQNSRWIKKNNRMRLQLSNVIQGWSIKCEFLSLLNSGSSIKHESIIQLKCLPCDKAIYFLPRHTLVWESHKLSILQPKERTKNVCFWKKVLRSWSGGRNNSVQPGIPKIHCQESILSYAPLFPHFVPPIILACSVEERLNFKFVVNRNFML